MKEQIESRIENLKKTLSWKEDELEQSRLGLVERASKCSAAEIAHGWLESDIDTIGQDSRGAKRLVYADDGRIYYTEDHYETFTLLYGEE